LFSSPKRHLLRRLDVIDNWHRPRLVTTFAELAQLAELTVPLELRARAHGLDIEFHSRLPTKIPATNTTKNASIV